MAHYLVRALPKRDRLDELEVRIRAGDFIDLEPFGRALSNSLRNARRDGDYAIWEEEDYCNPPLAQERDAVLDDYFHDITVETVERGEGWDQIEDLPRLFPGLE